jgi:hypothetical protein
MHPIARELYGFILLLAHKGDVWDIFKDLRSARNYYFSHGDTDFE